MPPVRKRRIRAALDCSAATHQWQSSRKSCTTRPAFAAKLGKVVALIPSDWTATVHHNIAFSRHCSPKGSGHLSTSFSEVFFHKACVRLRVARLKCDVSEEVVVINF